MYLDKQKIIFYDLLFVFLIFFGNFSDHGSKSFKNERSVSSICFGISVSKCEMSAPGAYDIDIEADDIDVTDTVTVVWTIA